jgi:hypothetical protein
MSQQQQQGAGSGATLIDLDDFIFDEAEEETWSPNQEQPHRYNSDISYKDQMREALSSTSSLGSASARAAGRVAAVPIVSAVAVSESSIATEEQEDRLQDAERRAAAAESARQAAEAAQQHQEVRLAQLERELATVRPPLPPPPIQQQPPPLLQETRDIFIRHNDEDFDDDEDEENAKQQHQKQQQQVVDTVKASTKVEDIANKSNDSSGNSSPKQPSQRQKICIVVIVVAVLIAAAAAGICGTGHCSSTAASPVTPPASELVVTTPALRPVAPPPNPRPTPVAIPSGPCDISIELSCYLPDSEKSCPVTTGSCIQFTELSWSYTNHGSAPARVTLLWITAISVEHGIQTLTKYETNVDIAPGATSAPVKHTYDGYWCLFGVTLLAQISGNYGQCTGDDKLEYILN